MSWALSVCPRGKLAPARIDLATLFAKASRLVPLLKAAAAIHLCALVALLEANEGSVLVLLSGAALVILMFTRFGGGLVRAADLAGESERSPSEHLAAVRAALASSEIGGPPPPACSHGFEPGMASATRRVFEARSQASAELMARVSHELRTPLNAVIGFSDLMGQHLFGPVGHPRYEEYVRHIQTSGRDLLKSAEDTLLLTALLAAPETPGPRACLDLERLASEAWAFLGDRAAARRLQLVIQAQSRLAVLGESRVLRQALINLFDAAIGRAAEGETIRLSASLAGAAVEIELSVRGPQAAPSAQDHPLPVCLARLLLEFQNAALTISARADGHWSAATVLEAAVQQDFFAAPALG
jgi:signal transduction histidine kinase